MELQTEASLLPVAAPVQPDLPSTPPPSPSAVEPLPSEPVAEVSPAEPVETAPAVPPAAEPAPAPPAEPTAPVELPVWRSLDDVKVDQLPEAVRPYMEQVVTMARAHMARRDEDVEVLREQHRAVQAQFEEWMGKLEGQDGTAVREYHELQKAAAAEIHDYAVHVVEITWEAFSARNPGYAALPASLKQEFGDLIGGPNFKTRFEGKNELARLEEAADYFLYKKGMDRAMLKQAGVAPAAPAPAARAPAPAAAPVPALEARRQSLVAEGPAINAPLRGVEEKDWKEILDAHDFALDDLFTRR